MSKLTSPAIIAGIAASSAFVLLVAILAIIIPLAKRRHRRLLLRNKAQREGRYTMYPESRFSLNDEDVRRMPGTKSLNCRHITDDVGRDPTYTPMAARVEKTSPRRVSTMSQPSQGSPPKSERGTPKVGPRRVLPYNTELLNSTSQLRRSADKSERPKSGATCPAPPGGSPSNPTPVVSTPSKGHKAVVDMALTPPLQPEASLASDHGEEPMRAKPEKGTSSTRTAKSQDGNIGINGNSLNKPPVSRSRSSSLCFQQPGPAPARAVSPLPIVPPLPLTVRRLTKSIRNSVSPEGSVKSGKKGEKTKRLSAAKTTPDPSPKIPEPEKSADNDWDMLIERINKPIEDAAKTSPFKPLPDVATSSKTDTQHSPRRSSSSGVPSSSTAHRLSPRRSIRAITKPAAKGDLLLMKHKASPSHGHRTSTKAHAPSPLAVKQTTSPSRNQSSSALRELSVNVPRSTSQTQRRSIFNLTDKSKCDREAFVAPTNLPALTKTMMHQKRNSYRVSKAPLLSSKNHAPRKTSTVEMTVGSRPGSAQSRRSSRYSKSMHRQTAIFRGRPPSSTSFDFKPPATAYPDFKFELKRVSQQNPFCNNSLGYPNAASTASIDSTYSMTNERTSSNPSPVTTPTHMPSHSYRMEAICTAPSDTRPYNISEAKLSDPFGPDDQVVTASAGQEPVADFDTFDNFTPKDASPSPSPKHFPPPPIRERDRRHTPRSSLKRASLRRSQTMCFDNGKITGTIKLDPSPTRRLSGSPTRRAAVRHKRRGNNLSLQIMELRRMNSDAHDDQAAGGKGGGEGRVSKENARYMSLGGSDDDAWNIFGPKRVSRPLHTPYVWEGTSHAKIWEGFGRGELRAGGRWWQPGSRISQRDTGR